MSETGYPESKAARKTQVRTQTATIADGQTVAASAFDKQAHDLCAFEVDTAFDGTNLSFGVANTLAEVTAGLTLADDGLAWEGTLVEIDCSTYRKQSIDPAKFAMWRYIVPISDTAQSGAACVVTAYFRDFRS